MKRFVRNDKRFYNMTKWQYTFLCINDRLQKSYKSLAKKLQKLQGCNKYLPLALDRCLPDSAGVCPQWRPVSVYTSKGAAFEELGAAFGSAGSCVSKGATSKRSIAAVGATILDY